MIMDDNHAQMIFGDLKPPEICLTGEEKPQKNLTHETCPNLGSNLGLRMLLPVPQRWIKKVENNEVVSTKPSILKILYIRWPYR